jgi:hypothetical protein
LLPEAHRAADGCGQIADRQNQTTQQALHHPGRRAAEQGMPHSGHQHRRIGGEHPQAAPTLDQTDLVGAALEADR